MATASTLPMTALIESYSGQIWVFVYVLTRLSGLAITAPIVGSRSVPVRVRAFLVLALTLLIAPLHWDVETTAPENLLQLAVLLVQEIVIGFGLGLGVMILMLGLQLSGHVASHMSGMALADIFDPGFDTSVPIFSQLLDVVAVAVFLILGGHRMVMDALLDTFQWMPPGASHISSGAMMFVRDVISQSFVLGMRAAAPIIVSLLLSMLVMGLISRTLPQLNILAVGLSLNSIMMLAAMAVSLGAMVWVFQEEVEPTIVMLQEVFSASRVADGTR